MRSRRLGNRLCLFAVFAAFFLANFPVIVSVQWLVPGELQLQAAAWLSLALIAIISLREDRELDEIRAKLDSNWLLFPFLLLSGLSILWSVAWHASLSRWIVLLAMVIVGARIGHCVNPKRLAKYLAIFSGIMLLLSGLVVLGAPQIGVMNYHSIQGAWKGIYWHKNHMGLLAAFACMVFLVNGIGALQARARSIWTWVVLYLLSLLFVSETDSVAAYLTLIVIHGVILLLVGHQKLRKRFKLPHYGAAAATLLILMTAIVANLDRVFSAFDRNTSLTGRVPMWGHLFEIYQSERPLFGYGFNAFWHIESHRVTMGRVAGYPDPIVVADNGFIDLLINTGYVGLALFLMFYAGLWWRSTRLAWEAVEVYGLFPLITMFYVLVANLTWSLIFENEGFFMLIMIALLFSMTHGRDTGELRQLAPSKRSAEPPPDPAGPRVSA